MSADWVKDISLMHDKYQVREWINDATPFQLKKFLEFRLAFIKEEYDETKEALDHGRCRRSRMMVLLIYVLLLLVH